MPNVFKYTTGALPTNCLEKGDFAIGNNTGDYGLTFYNGITPPSGGYTIYLNKTSNGPSIYVASSDAQLITITNQIAGANYTTVAQCLNYFVGQSDKLCVNRDYEGIVIDGLVLNLDAGFTPSYATTGTTWYDISGNARNGTLTNGPTFNSSGGTIVFDGVDDYVSVNTAIGNAISTTSSTSFWLYRSTTFNTSNTSVGQFLFGSYTDDSNRGIVYFSSDSGYVGSLGSLLVSGGSIRGRVYTQQNSWGVGWYNIVFTRTASSYKIYVNGVDMTLTTVTSPSNTIAYPANPTRTFIGANFFSSLNAYGYLTGRIANALFYNKVLSSAEVLQNYNAQKARFGIS
jgi:hypothetical protein